MGHVVAVWRGIRSTFAKYLPYTTKAFFKGYTAIVNAEFYQSHGRVTVCTNGHLLKMDWNAKLLIFLGGSSWKKAVPLLKNYGRYDMAKLWLITVPELKRPHHPWNRFILVWVCKQIVQWTEKFQFLITHNSSVCCTHTQCLCNCCCWCIGIQKDATIFA